jgi:hypothetical protein
MRFRVHDREAEIELRGFDPFPGEKCELCGENEWKWKVFYNDDEAYDWICEVTGRADGLFICCQECFEKRIKPYDVQYAKILAGPS